MPYTPQKDKIIKMDFTSANPDLSGDTVEDTALFSQYINRVLQQNDAVYGIGGYDENRTIYTRSDVFNAIRNNEEPRRLHLGVDIWGKAGTTVFAPLGGVIHSFANNNLFGDYGATIVLSHQLNGLFFYTLYGHLSIRNLVNLEAGKFVSHGEAIGNFGEPFENGNWPPHLHFQIIKDMHGKWGDYPGVCAYSRKEKYLLNCPDPELMLQMRQHAVEPVVSQ